MSLRRSMAGLHTWGGLLPSWLLLVILFAGSLACFDKELERWMRPALHVPGAQSLTLDQARAWLTQRAPDAHAFWMRPPDGRQPFWRVGYEPADESAFVNFALDPATGAPLAETQGGEFFFTLHYNLQAGTVGMYIVGLAGMFMLVALISGVIIHRRIFKDFFTLRPDANGQRAWLDAHNLFGVLGLPFHLLLAYTGVAIFVASYMPAAVQVAYQSDGERFFNEIMGGYAREDVQQPAPPAVSLDGLLEDAKRRWGDDQVGWVSIHHPADAAAVVDMRHYSRSRIADFQWILSYDAGTGALLHEQKPYGAGYQTYAWMTGVHMAQFGGSLVRGLYLLLGLAGCAMLIGGVQVWLRKREARGGAGVSLVRALNGAVIGGLPLASLVLLYANRLLPSGLAERAAAEAYAFVGAWLLVALWAIWRRNSGQVGRDLLRLGAVLALGLPLVNALVTPHGSLLASLGRADWALAGIDLTLLGVGGLCAVLGYRRRQPHVAPQRRPRLAEEGV